MFSPSLNDFKHTNVVKIAGLCRDFVKKYAGRINPAVRQGKNEMWLAGFKPRICHQNQTRGETAWNVRCLIYKFVKKYIDIFKIYYSKRHTEELEKANDKWHYTCFLYDTYLLCFVLWLYVIIILRFNNKLQDLYYKTCSFLTKKVHALHYMFLKHIFSRQRSPLHV